MIAADWQAELAGVTLGAGTRYILTGPIGGLGIAAPRVTDTERGLEPGDVAGVDVAARRVLTVPVGVDGVDADDGWALLDTLMTAWTPTPTDVAFELRLPGFASTARRFYGRPRGLESDLSLLRAGWIDVLATFEALDPYGYGPATNVALSATETPIVANQTVGSDRWVATLDVTDDPASFTIGDATLTFVDLAGPVTLDGRSRTIIDDTGIGLYSHVEPGSIWPTVAPGAQTVTVVGATGTLAYRPAYL